MSRQLGNVLLMLISIGRTVEVVLSRPTRFNIQTNTAIQSQADNIVQLLHAALGLWIEVVRLHPYAVANREDLISHDSPVVSTLRDNVCLGWKMVEAAAKALNLLSTSAVCKPTGTNVEVRKVHTAEAITCYINRMKLWASTAGALPRSEHTRCGAQTPCRYGAVSDCVRTCPEMADSAEDNASLACFASAVNALIDAGLGHLTEPEVVSVFKSCFQDCPEEKRPNCSFAFMVWKRYKKKQQWLRTLCNDTLEPKYEIPAASMTAASQARTVLDTQAPPHSNATGTFGSNKRRVMNDRRVTALKSGKAVKHNTHSMIRTTSVYMYVICQRS